MNYVGIDIAKQTHYATIMNSDGEILVAPFSFSNDHTGFQKLLKYLSLFPQATLANKTFKDYYDLKVSQGRRHYNALGHVAHKLVRVIHKMMTDNVEFNLT